jgi:hypothetical protein
MSTTKSKENAFTWPDDQLDPIMLAKLNDRISKFVLEQPEPLGEGAAAEVQAKFDFDEGAAALELCVDLYKIYRNSDSPSVEEELLALGAEWKTVEPGYAYIRNFFSLLMTGQLEGASKNFEKSEEYKEAMITEGVTQAKSQAAADSVNKRHAKTNDAKAEIIEDYKKNKNDFVSKKDAANKYEHRFPLLSHRTIYDILKGL